MRKALSIITVFLAALTAFAEDGYTIDVIRTYPNRATIYSQTFKTRHDLDAAVASQRSRLNNGALANYKIVTKSPKGSSVIPIQKITWIEYVNGTAQYNGRRSPQGSYASPTTWKGGSCGLDGPSGNMTAYEFLYRVKVKGEDGYRTQYLTKSSAEAQAKTIFEKLSATNNSVVVNVCKISGGKETVVYTRPTNSEVAQREAAEIAKQQAIEQKQRQDSVIATFTEEMAIISSHKDSLRANDLGFGIRCCRAALDNLLEEKIVPDSVLLSKGIDVLYLKVLTQDLLADTDNEKALQLIDDFKMNYSHDKPENYFHQLACLAEQLDLAILEGDSEDEEVIEPGPAVVTIVQKNETPKKPAHYLNEVKNYDVEYSKEENGVSYKYYCKNNKCLKVNVETEEYWTGKGSFDSNGNFVWEKEKDVKHYDRDGKEIKKDAYIDKIPANCQPDAKVENGITYLYYQININKSEWMRVNSVTKEYEIGVGGFDAEGIFRWYPGKKVKRYSQDGKLTSK